MVDIGKLDGIQFSRWYVMHNIVAGIGLASTFIFRLWGFSALICSLFIWATRGKASQYLSIIAVDLIYAWFLYLSFRLISSQGLFIFTLLLWR